jgi:hypothetical protein
VGLLLQSIHSHICRRECGPQPGAEAVAPDSSDPSIQYQLDGSLNTSPLGQPAAFASIDDA